MNIKDKNQVMKIIYNEAKLCLEQMCPPNINIEQYFKINNDVKNLNNVFYVMLFHLQREFQIDIKKEQIAIEEILFNYHSEMVLSYYNEDKLYYTFSEKFTLDFPKTKKSQWRLYAKSIISVANFLNSFSSFEEFDKFIFNNKTQKLEFIQLLQNKIFGMNFSVACKILEELGYEEYSKINIHIKDILANFNLCDELEYHIFNFVSEMANVVNDTVYRINQLFLLVCTGNFYYDNIRTNRNKEKLIERIMIKFYQKKILESIYNLQDKEILPSVTLNHKKILQTTVIRKYINNYKYTYGRITLDGNTINKFLGFKKTCKIIVMYDEEHDCLIIEKINL